MRKQFTLIELMVVVVILALIATLVIPNVSSQKEKATTAMIQNNIQIFQTASDIYSIENNGSYPTIIEPTLGSPQLIKMDLLYPNYIKSLPKEKDLSKQNYWVDYTGKVWGATVDSPSNMFNSTGNVEWSTDQRIVGYNVYEVKSKTTGAIQNKQMFSLKQYIAMQPNINKIKLDKDSNQQYLITAVDQYGLETAPVGFDYEGKPQGDPILMQEGEFYYELNSEETLYWDDFKTVEEKPEGTKITYSFAANDNPNELTDFISDFSDLQPAKNLRIKIKMEAYAGKYPSLYDLRVFYHYADDTVLTSKRVTQSNTKVTDEVKLEQDQYVERVVLPDSYQKGAEPTVDYTYSTTGSNFKPVTTLSDIPAGSYLQITRETTDPERVEFKEPLVYGSNTPAKVYSPSGNANGETLPNDAEVKDKSWQTIQTLSFFASTGDGQKTHWISADIVDDQPQNTRILYRYATSNDGLFGNYAEDFGQLQDSRMLKVMVYLQVKKEFVSQQEHPSVTSIKLNHSKGVIDLDTVKPTGVITIQKSNNTNNDIVSVDSKITWDYDAFDPQGKKIVDAEWGGDKREQYTTPGTYTVTLKLRNELNYWSNTITYTFEVKPEKPVAVLKPDTTTFYSKTPIKWDTSNSYDPDNDGIAKVEWGGDYRQDNLYPKGTYTITMKVKDNEGNWSDPVSKTFKTVDSIFIDAPANAVDQDNGTYASINGPTYAPQTMYYTWVGDMSNRKITIVGSKVYKDSSSYTVSLGFVNAQNQDLPFINADTNQYITSYDVPTTKTNMNFIVPEGATKIKVYISYVYFNLYELIDYEDKVLPQPVTNVSHEATKNSIALKWNNPADSDFNTVTIYRNGTYIGSSKTGAFTDTPLMSDTNYSYTMKSVDTTGNRSTTVTYMAKTNRPDIVWSGVGAAALDEDSNTYATIDGPTYAEKLMYIPFQGNLDNKKITIVGNAVYKDSKYYVRITFANDKDQELSFINADTNQIISSYEVPTTKTNMNFVVPPGATKIKLHIAYIYFRVYEIIDYPDKVLPEQVTNVSNEATKNSITLNWNNPNDSDFKTVDIYRNNTYVGSTTAETFTDKPLMSDTNYTYTLKSVDTTGNRSTVTYTARTIRPPIVWSGIDANALDENTTTYATIDGPTYAEKLMYIPWQGDLSNKKITIVGNAVYKDSKYYVRITFANDQNQEIPFTNADTNKVITSYEVPTTKTNMHFIVPEGATKIKLHIAYIYFRVYEIIDYQ